MKKLHEFSIKSMVTVAVGLMGLVSLVLTFFTSNVFVHLVEDDRKHLLVHLFDKEFESVLERLSLEMQDIAVTIGENPQFNRGLSDRRILSAYLQQQFQRYFADDGLVEMTSISVFDAEFKNISTVGNGGNGKVCNSLFLKMIEEKIAKRKVAVCSNGQHGVYAVLVAVGGLQPIAYMQVESNLEKIFFSLERSLDIPLRAKLLSTNKVVFQPTHHVENDSDYALYFIKHNGQAVIEIDLIIDDLHAFNHEIQEKIFYIVLSTIAITILAIILVMYVLGQNLVVPMGQLSQHIRRVRNNREALAEKINVGGNREIKELAKDYNAMTAELDNLYTSLQLMALTDPLTKLPNRLSMHDRLRDLIKTSGELNRSFALCILDLDKFKDINDTYGHIVGDEFLRKFAERILQCISLEMYCTEKDQRVRNLCGDVFAARLGGDEFALLLPMVKGRAEVMTTLTQFLGLVSEPLYITGFEYSVVPSIGVSIFPEDGADYSQLFRCADTAMYLAKKSGLGVAGSHNRDEGVSERAI